MPGLNVFLSNRLENLVSALAETLRVPLPSPLRTEMIVVQSKGMERWVSLELAKRHRVAANLSFPFPNALIEVVFRVFLADPAEGSPFEPEVMTWRIMEVLSDPLRRRQFPDLDSYLSDDETGLKQLQMSIRIADLFDQYLLFRPEMILRWDNGSERHWQAVLWREVAAGTDRSHRATQRNRFFQHLHSREFIPGSLPERISVFGISYLPPFHLDILRGLASTVQVNLFLMNPTGEYWGDIVSEREMRQYTVFPSESGPLHLEEGNSLLASLGRRGRAFFSLVSELEDSTELEDFEDPGERSILACVQSDILHLRNRYYEQCRLSFDVESDRSIEFHSCHGTMREVEVLHDHLLGMFDEKPTLEPHHIMVMTPDVEVYAPFVRAVFGAPENESLRIPFRIADQSLRKEGLLAEPFLSILDLAAGRLGATDVLSILEAPAVRRTFGLSELDVDLIQRWIEETHIKWGVSASERAGMGLPAIPENTWSAGLDRLLLGYAMRGEGRRMFDGILPFDGIEGGEAIVLGSFVEFMDRIFQWRMALGNPHNLSEWAEMLEGILDDFFEPRDENEFEMRMLRRLISSLTEMEDRSGFSGTVAVEVVRSYLKRAFEREGFGLGFLAGGVTFCSMLPMRSIPFRVVCLLGMNDDSFPRKSSVLGFDLMAKAPRKGDRSRREDDRYLFLEAILSAREKLYISYVGQSIRDNSKIPPSVVVSELLDYVRQGFQAPGREAPSRWVCEHSLQAFNSMYFDPDGDLLSYSEENCGAARSLRAHVPQPFRFIASRLDDPGEEWRVVDVEQLCSFYANPCRFLLKQRLGVALDEEPALLDDRELFALDRLEEYVLKQELNEELISGADAEAFFARARASGRLPHGAAGICEYDRVENAASRFSERLRPIVELGALAPVEVNVPLAGFRLTARIDHLYPGALLHARCAKIKAQDRLRIWIHYLALGSSAHFDSSRKGILIGEDKTFVYRPPNQPERILETLLLRYWEGLCRPIHFFPEASLAFAGAAAKDGKMGENALKAARRVWDAPWRPEAADRYYELCLRDSTPLDNEFEQLSQELFGPLLERQEEHSLWETLEIST
ncbi:MAG: exodeoxyribonuclease V subunit gamma [Deltaproteobacteria bacterium]|nr:exodeoxyribonuclease V subunit gamma [Deltaproteobacteria bacterium]